MRLQSLDFLVSSSEIEVEMGFRVRLGLIGCG